MKESTILAAIVRDLKSRKARGEPVWWVKIAGGPLQRPGLPDLHITYGGRSIWLELKAPGKKPTPLQEATIARIREAGGMAEVIDSFDVYYCIMGTENA